MSCLSEHVGYIQGCVVELGPTIPPSWFHLGNPSGEFICYARGLIFEGNVVAYDPSTNRVKWIPMHGNISDLSWVEGMSALAWCNMVPHTPDEGLRD